MKGHFIKLIIAFITDAVLVALLSVCSIMYNEQLVEASMLEGAVLWILFISPIHILYLMTMFYFLFGRCKNNLLYLSFVIIGFLLWQGMYYFYHVRLYNWLIENQFETYIYRTDIINGSKRRWIWSDSGALLMAFVLTTIVFSIARIILYQFGKNRKKSNL